MSAGRRGSIAGVVVAGCLALPPAVAHAEVVHVRNGFTIELGLGIAHTTVWPDQGDGLSKIGIAPLSLSLGAFLNQDLALMVRMAGTSFFEDVGGSTQQFVHGFYGLHLQYWFADYWMVSGGPGLMLYGVNPLNSNADIGSEAGLGFSARGTYSFANWENHSLRFALELFPGFYDGANVLGSAINFEWQHF